MRATDMKCVTYRVFTTALAAVAVLLIPATECSARIEFERIGNIGDMEVEPSDLSPSGEYVVGGAKVTGSEWEHRAFIWSRGTSAVVLEPNSHSLGISVADDGTAVGVSSDNFGTTVPAMWKADGLSFESVEGGLVAERQIVPEAISGDGQTVVGFFDFDLNESRGVKWDDTLQLTTELELPLMNEFSRPASLSFDGSVVLGNSWSFENDIRRHPVVWNSQGVTELSDENGRIPGEGIALSPDGNAVVGYDLMSKSSWIWRNGTLVEDEVSLRPSKVPGLFIQEATIGVSRFGEVIVGTSVPADEAAIWDEAEGIRLVRTIIMNVGREDVLENYVLESAIDVSSDGRMILGTGKTLDGRLDPWILTLPYPGDANGDETVAFDDFVLLAAQFGESDIGLR